MTYVDHDRTEVDSDDTDSNLAWPGFGKSRHHVGSTKSLRSQYDSPPDPYDSPYASPPGPYDSPESDTDREESISENVLTRFVRSLPRESFLLIECCSSKCHTQ